jgi:membrane protein YqaA with SNARE-associated domain
MILRILAFIVIIGGTLGALGGYCMVRWLDRRRERADWERATEWLAREEQDDRQT